MGKRCGIKAGGFHVLNGALVGGIGHIELVIALDLRLAGVEDVLLGGAGSVVEEATEDVAKSADGLAIVAHQVKATGVVKLRGVRH